MSDLHLNLKSEYYEQIATGEKEWEYRLYNDYWKKRLVGKSFDKILVKRGYPKRDDMENQMIRPWNGYIIEEIVHPHFHNKSVTVFAIKVN